MARRKPSVEAASVLDEREAVQRLDWIMGAVFPHGQEAGSPTRVKYERLTAALWRYRESLDRRAVPAADQVGLVETWLEDLGELDRVRGRVEHLERCRERWSMLSGGI